GVAELPRCRHPAQHPCLGFDDRRGAQRVVHRLVGEHHARSGAADSGAGHQPAGRAPTGDLRSETEGQAMRTRPLIGITVHSADVRAREGNRETRFEMSARYAQAVARAGGLPLLVPAHPSVDVPVEETLAALDGLLVSGGGGLSSDYFVENPNPSLRDTNLPRYDVEVEMIRSAWQAGMPLLGICRGHQTMVEAMGGTLVNDLRSDVANAEHYPQGPATAGTHSLARRADALRPRLVPDGAMADSFPRQVVATVPAGWHVTAWSPDGLVQAAEGGASGQTGAQRFAIGCQF